MGLSVIMSINLLCVDLREDKQYLNEHPGIVPITTAQVSCNIPYSYEFHTTKLFQRFFYSVL